MGSKSSKSKKNDPPPRKEEEKRTQSAPASLSPLDGASKEAAGSAPAANAPPRPLTAEVLPPAPPSKPSPPDEQTRKTPQPQAASPIFAPSPPPKAQTPPRPQPRVDHAAGAKKPPRQDGKAGEVVELTDESIAFFGAPAMTGLKSKVWADREHGMKTIQRLLAEKAEQVDSIRIWNCTIKIVAVMLKDKIAPVYFASVDVLKALVYHHVAQVPAPLLKDGLTPLLPTLLHRTGNLNVRIHEASIDCLLSLASEMKIGPEIFAPHILTPIRKGSKNIYGATVGRMDLIQRMLNVFGLEGSALTKPGVLDFAKPALEVADDKVRRAASDTLVELYKVAKVAGSPLHDSILLSIKPALVKSLQHRFHEVDEYLISTGMDLAEVYGDGSSGGAGGVLPPLGGPRPLGPSGGGMDVRGGALLSRPTTGGRGRPRTGASGGGSSSSSVSFSYDSATPFGPSSPGAAPPRAGGAGRAPGTPGPRKKGAGGGKPAPRPAALPLGPYADDVDWGSKIGVHMSVLDEADEALLNEIECC